MPFIKLQVAGAILLGASCALAQNAILEPGVVPEPAVEASEYKPLTISERYKWAAKTPASGQRLAGFAVSSALSTWRNRPEEYGPHWEGYGKRIGIRMASGATGTMMEATIGALWNEDPRYVRAEGQPFKKRLTHVAKMTFMARNRNGEMMPAYARYISVPANSFMTNAFRADSEANARDATIRIPMNFLSRAIGNAFTEFWPDATRWMHRD